MRNLRRLSAAESLAITAFILFFALAFICKYGGVRMVSIGHARVRPSIAVGFAITSKGNVDGGDAKLPLLTSLVPTFCKTASPGFNYRLYLGIDDVDPLYSNGKTLTIDLK